MTSRIVIVLACCASLLVLPSTAPADEAEPLFNPTAVAEIDFTLPPASLQKLEEEPKTSDYQHAAITAKVGDTTYSLGDVGIRLKGSLGSFRNLTGKAAFKVKFNEFVKGQKLLGLKKMTLNNMVQDPSMVHETMTYHLFRAMGLPAPRTGYAFVRVNGEPYGVYLDVETYDDISLPHLFPSTQHLYEADAAGVDVRPGEADTFEVDEGDDEDLSDLEALIAAADTVGDWSDDMAAVADLAEMTRMWAVERYTGHWDSYSGPVAPFRPNNYYLHSRDDGVFSMLPWGTDQTWDVDMEFDEPAGGLLFNNCLDDASCEALYEAGLEEVAATVPGLDLDQTAICTADMLEPWQGQEDPARAEHDAKGIADGVADARSFMSVRVGMLADYLGLAPPSGVPDGTARCPHSERPLVTDRVQMPPATEQGDKARFPRLGSFSRNGKRLRVKLFSPRSGTLALSAKAKGHRVCGSETAVGAGLATVTCRLTGAAVKALAEGPLRLGVQVRFPGADGTSISLSRNIRMARI